MPATTLLHTSQPFFVGIPTNSVDSAEKSTATSRFNGPHSMTYPYDVSSSSSNGEASSSPERGINTNAISNQSQSHVFQLALQLERLQFQNVTNNAPTAAVINDFSSFSSYQNNSDSPTLQGGDASCPSNKLLPNDFRNALSYFNSAASYSQQRNDVSDGSQTPPLGCGINDGGSPTQAMMERRSGNMTECVAVPSSEHVAEIVGKQGCKIKTLRAKTNTYIKTPIRGEEPVFVITGRKEDVENAKAEIVSAADHFTQIRAQRRLHPPAQPGQVTIKMQVPLRLVGLIVGPKGQTIKRIQQETNTYIVTPGREKDPVFDITGANDGVETARGMIAEHILNRTGNTLEELLRQQAEQGLLGRRDSGSTGGRDSPTGSSRWRETANMNFEVGCWNVQPDDEEYDQYQQNFRHQNALHHQNYSNAATSQFNSSNAFNKARSLSFSVTGSTGDNANSSLSSVSGSPDAPVNGATANGLNFQRHNSVFAGDYENSAANHVNAKRTNSDPNSIDFLSSMNMNGFAKDINSIWVGSEASGSGGVTSSMVGSNAFCGNGGYGTGFDCTF